MKKPTVLKVNQECQTDPEKSDTVKKPQINTVLNKTTVSSKVSVSGDSKHTVSKPATTR